MERVEGLLKNILIITLINTIAIQFLVPLANSVCMYYIAIPSKDLIYSIRLFVLSAIR